MVGDFEYLPEDTVNTFESSDGVGSADTLILDHKVTESDRIFVLVSCKDVSSRCSADIVKTVPTIERLGAILHVLCKRAM